MYDHLGSIHKHPAPLWLINHTQAHSQARPQENPRIPFSRFVPWRQDEIFGARNKTDVALEGVLVAKKDFNLPKHNEIDTKNLYVRCATTTICAS